MSVEELTGRDLDRAVLRAMPELADSLPFECPVCGGAHFGSSESDDGTRTRHCHGQFRPCDWSGAPMDSVPSVSADISAAWEVVERCCVGMDGYAGRRRDAFPTIWKDKGSDLWVCDFGKLGGAWAKTAPEAICRAALDAVRTVRAQKDADE